MSRSISLSSAISIGSYPRHTAFHLIAYSLAHCAPQVVTIIAKKEISSCPCPVNSVMQHPHLFERVLAGARLQNNPVRDLPQSVLPIEGHDVWVIQGRFRHTIAGGYDAGFLPFAAPFCQGCGGKQDRCYPEIGWQIFGHFDPPKAIG